MEDLYGDGRMERANQRADRSWSEMLQELQVPQARTQILAGMVALGLGDPAQADPKVDTAGQSEEVSIRGID